MNLQNHLTPRQLGVTTATQDYWNPNGEVPGLAGYR
jgi:hypothetical protein